MDTSDILIVGGNGQLGLALQARYPQARAVDSDVLDITSPVALGDFDWSGIHTIINAAAYTNVDGAEASDGRVTAWAVNARGARNLAETALTHDITLVHISTDYVFDGTEASHTETEPFSPLGVYGQSKAAGDIAVSLTPKHYILRTSWVIGDGKNFVRSILGLGAKGISPSVVADQFGRLTFTSELVRAIDFLLSERASYGTYNVSNGGDIASWADIARQIYVDAGFEALTVSDTTAEAFFAGKLSSPRPVHSGLDLAKIEAVGFTHRDWRDDLHDYITLERAKSQENA